ncbi:DUF4435 domain-containing protein [Paenibacillus polymyxa]|uniref:DUF4435 domain-containing protein n=1 Tax=Paenibacillus polymyxa TaxID=1406 RepID=UPI00058A1DFA|nr:DUF4435 domain-containing protein [Paenibacillus polymyxa]AJE53054.1 hypothetical protein RE92_19455 [Paenibacillus polymyxa]QOH63104.1 DUF4435 domain-containing protein [Paenibacillus polymyxa]
MIEYITPERIANSIMQDGTFSGHYLIVEGNKDYKFYNKFVTKEISIEEAWGCEKVKSVIHILKERNYERAIGIIDSDFSVILEEPIDCDGIFVTDFHDIEVMMLKSTALYNILDLYCSKEKIVEFFKDKDALDILMELGIEIGLLKLANKIYNLGLVFKPERPEGNQLKYKEFVSEKDLTFLGKSSMIQTVVNYSRNRTGRVGSIADINEKLNLLAPERYDPAHLVNGHDLTNILFILIKKVLKSTNKMLHDYNSVEDSLILTYDNNEFIKTDLFYKLYLWSRERGVNLFKSELTEQGKVGSCLSVAN